MTIPVPALPAAAAHTSVAANAMAASAQASNSDTGFSFGDFLDIINPLQHIPVISTVYRAITGDKIGDAEQVAGDALYGGVVGLGSSIANLIFKDATGKSLGDTVLAWAENATGIHLGSDQPTALADAKTPNGATLASSGQGIAPVNVAALTTASGAPTATAPSLGQPSTQIADNAPATVTPAQATSLLADPAAFMATLKARGIDPTLALRAMTAYEKYSGIGIAAKAAAQP